MAILRTSDGEHKGGGAKPCSGASSRFTDRNARAAADAKPELP